jgi:hypothetical protein
MVDSCRKLFKLYLLIGGETLTKKEARGCITRTVTRYTVTNVATGECVDFEKLPTPMKMARMYPEGYAVETVNKLYALPIETFMQYAQEVTE